MENLLSSLGSVSAVIGAQWGDEGKGKAVDILSEHFDVIARAAGGANAGHTIVINGKKHVFHLLPSGCFHEGKTVVLGSGMVIHLPTLLEEINLLKEEGVDIVPRLFLSPSAHIVFDYHKEIDGWLEQQRSSSKQGSIGTTRRGIGPAYADKASRVGIRLEMFFHDAALTEEALNHRATGIKEMYGIEINIAKEMDAFRVAQELLRPQLLPNPPQFLADKLSSNNTILLEGAQATLLDIDHGTYPYVTSSSTTLAGALQGLGLAPKHVSSCIGVAKAYCTRVGEGTFFTEETGETGDRLRERGGEYGATTSRPRRCGWLDVHDLRYAATINGYTAWNVTKLDVLDEEDVIPVCTGINPDGSPRYQELQGWKTSTAGVTSFDELPEEAQCYIEFIEEQTNVPVRLIGTGQGREEMIVR